MQKNLIIQESLSKTCLTNNPPPRLREKIMAQGPEQLSDQELMCLLLGSGIKGRRVTELARDVVTFIDKQKNNISPEDLLKIPGLGQAKSTLIAACLEFSRRLLIPERPKIILPESAYQYLRHYGDRKQEIFLSLSLNGAHELIKTRIVSIGLVNRTMVHPREVFADPITDRAAAVICAHNHPSGQLQPSQEDREITRILKSAGDILGIKLLDHIIFTDKGFYSFQEHGLI
ncbi:MAG: DNA repair protein RadC [Spirochaetales bacterium]|nr:DNA repair protein RadC [Spirochaetales bacterium]